LVGGLAVARHRTGRSTAGPDDDFSLRLGVNGAWARPIGGNIITVTFLAADGGAVTLEGPCGIYVSRNYQIADGRLHLGEPLSSPEAHCNEPLQASSIASLVTTLSSDPTIALGECTTPEVRTLTAVQTPDCSQLRIGDLTLFCAPATPARLAMLDGNTYVLAGMADTARGPATAVRGIVRITFAGARLDIRSGCNAGHADVVLDRNVVLVSDVAIAVTQACGDDAAAFGDLLVDLPTLSQERGGLVLNSMDGRVAVLVEGGRDQSTPPTTAADVGVPLPTTVAPPSDVLAELKGRWFAVSTWRDGSTTVVSGSRVRFDGDAVYFGCWHIAPARIENGRLLLGELTILKAACPEIVDDVGALQTVLTGAPRIRIEGDVLTLATSDGLGAVLHETTGTPPPPTPTTISSTTTIAPADQVPTLEQRWCDRRDDHGRALRRVAVGAHGDGMRRRADGAGRRRRRHVDFEPDDRADRQPPHACESLVDAHLRRAASGRTRRHDLDHERTHHPARRRVRRPAQRAPVEHRRHVDVRWVRFRDERPLHRRRFFLGVHVRAPDITRSMRDHNPRANEVTAVVQMLQGPVTFAIGDEGLRLTGPDGNGEVFVAGS
jgi:hypothetical protein